MQRYSPIYDPGSNARGVDTSDQSNPAPQGARVKSKKRVRRAGKKSMRQKSESSLVRELSLSHQQDIFNRS